MLSVFNGITDMPNLFHFPFQPSSPFSPRKSLHYDDKKHLDDEDNWSVTSSYPKNLNIWLLILNKSIFRYIGKKIESSILSTTKYQTYPL